MNFHELDDPVNLMHTPSNRRATSNLTSILGLLWMRLFLSCAVSDQSSFLMTMDSREISSSLVKTSQLGNDIHAVWYHKIFYLDTGSIFYKIKAGPYNPKHLNDFASWGPLDSSSEIRDFLVSLKKLAGDIY